MLNFPKDAPLFGSTTPQAKGRHKTKSTPPFAVSPNFRLAEHAVDLTYAMLIHRAWKYLVLWTKFELGHKTIR